MHDRMTWQSHAEHSASWLSPFCAKAVMMVGKGRAAVAEKPSHICKVAAYIIAWLQKGKPRQGGRKRSTCGHTVTLIPVLEGTLSASQPRCGHSIALLCLSAQGRRLAEAGSTSRRDLAPAADAAALWTGLPPGQLCPEHGRVLPLMWTATLLATVSSF